jgi:hypothetical protein
LVLFFPEEAVTVVEISFFFFVELLLVVAVVALFWVTTTEGSLPRDDGVDWVGDKDREDFFKDRGIPLFSFLPRLSSSTVEAEYLRVRGVTALFWAVLLFGVVWDWGRGGAGGGVKLAVLIVKSSTRESVASISLLKSSSQTKVSSSSGLCTFRFPFPLVSMGGVSSSSKRSLERVAPCSSPLTAASGEGGGR